MLFSLFYCSAKKQLFSSFAVADGQFREKCSSERVFFSLFFLHGPLFISGVRFGGKEILIDLSGSDWRRFAKRPYIQRGRDS